MRAALSSNPLCRIDQAFEYGVLYALPFVFAQSSHSAKASAPCFVARAYVVANQYKHMLWILKLLPPEERWIRIEAATEMTCQEQGLHIRDEADRNFLLQERMFDRFLLARLPCSDNELTPLIPQ